MEPRGASFQLSYDGPALVTHEMDVKDLAPALLAMGELLEDANRVLNGERVKVHVNLKATREGSVVVDLSVVQNFLDQTISLFSGKEASAIVNAVEILSILGIGGGAGVVAVLKWLRNRPIKNVVTLEEGNFRLVVADGDAKVVSEKELKLFGFVNIRKRLEAVIATPLSKIGIDSVAFQSEGRSKEEVTKEEAVYFTAPDVGDELIDEKEVEMSLQLVNVSFQENGKWRFTDGNATFFAEIVDRDFLDKVDDNEVAFAKDDLIKAVLRRKQFITSTGIKTDYIIIKISEHRTAARQITLPFLPAPEERK